MIISKAGDLYLAVMRLKGFATYGATREEAIIKVLLLAGLTK